MDATPPDPGPDAGVLGERTVDPDPLVQFGRYYITTSVTWDAFRAVGDAIAVVALGTPVLMALGRLRARLGYEIVDAPQAG